MTGSCYTPYLEVPSSPFSPPPALALPRVDVNVLFRTIPQAPMSTPDLTPSFSSSSSSTYSSPSPAAVGGARPFQPVEPCDCGTTYCRCGLQIPQCLVEVTPLSLSVCVVCACVRVCRVCGVCVLSCAHSHSGCRAGSCAGVHPSGVGHVQVFTAMRQRLRVARRSDRPPQVLLQVHRRRTHPLRPRPLAAHNRQRTTHDKTHGPDHRFFGVRSAEVRRTTVAPSSLARTRVGVARRCWFAICRSTGARYLPFSPATVLPG